MKIYFFLSKNDKFQLWVLYKSDWTRNKEYFFYRIQNVPKKIDDIFPIGTLIKI